MEPDTRDVASAMTEPQGIDWDDEDGLLRLMQIAVADALREHKEKGQYIVAMRDGKIVDIPPEEIVVPIIE